MDMVHYHHVPSYIGKYVVIHGYSIVRYPLAHKSLPMYMALFQVDRNDIVNHEPKWKLILAKCDNKPLFIIQQLEMSD